MRWFSHDDKRLGLEDEESESTHIEPAHTQLGEMMDFLKAYPFITIEDYRWKLTIPEIKLMAYDATKVIYLSEKQQKKIREEKSIQRIDNPMDLLNDFGMPVFNKK